MPKISRHKKMRRENYLKMIKKRYQISESIEENMVGEKKLVADEKLVGDEKMVGVEIMVEDEITLDSKSPCSKLPLEHRSNLKEATLSNEDNFEDAMEVEQQTATPPILPSIGRRIVDVTYFFNKLKEIANHGPLDCGLHSLQIVNEKKQNGLKSKFTVTCELCNQKFFIENVQPADLHPNKRAVAGIVAIEEKLVADEKLVGDEKMVGVEIMVEDEITLDSKSPCSKLPLEHRSNLKEATLSNEDNFEDAMEVEQQTATPPILPSIGRRIVDVTYFFINLKEIANHGPLDCGLYSLQIVNEKQNGLMSKFTVICELCNQKFFIENVQPADLHLNKRAVAGIVAIGCGHSQLQEFSAALDLPIIGPKTYQTCHDNIAQQWEKIALDSMNEAAEIERNMAIKKGRVDKNGVPIIDVILDGCWSKRSYKKNYTALSGAATIIGKETGKVLYLGVKNKYCCICAQAEKNKCKPKQHTCYKNFSGPSTGMESAILVEGFKNSIEMHNLIYGRMVSDGDSSTFSKLLQCRPYPHLTIQKIECRNHILRNLCNKLDKLKSDTNYPVRFRKLVTLNRIMIIRRTIRTVIKKHKNDSDVELLYSDLLLVHLHAFENHTTCKPYFCTKSSSTSQKIDTNFFSSNLWSKICLIISNVASNAPSLIHDIDSNAVERYNSIVAKLVGGKRVNYSLKGSYQARCNAAVVSFNTHKVLSSIYKNTIGRSPRGQMSKLESLRRRKLTNSTKYLRVKRKIIGTTHSQDAEYGENCMKPDMEPEIYDKQKAAFLINLKYNQAEREKIQKETVLQSGCNEWVELRRSLLTASNFGKISKRRKDVSCASLVKTLLYKDSLSEVLSIKHGRENEKIALEQLAKQENIKIKPCGLFIDSEVAFLGASPDGIVDKNTIIEIKCPITAFKLGLNEAIEQKKLPFYKKEKNGQLKINQNHDWFYQIQGQLHITGAEKCIFGLWYGEHNPVKVEIIKKDDSFWNNMKPKLEMFYLDCILPELVDPRTSRSLPIRDPDYIVKAVAEKKNKTTAKQNKTTDCKT